jgi:hypothetical protein
MATSGTTTFNPDVSELCEEAFERAGLELRTGYDLRTARRSLNFLLSEWANKGLNLWTIEQASFDTNPVAVSYDLPTDTSDVIEAVCRIDDGLSTQFDQFMNRIPVSTYATQSNKNTTGKPTQFYIERALTPKIYLWPKPDVITYKIVYWRLRRIQDAGAGGSFTLDIPFRFYNAMAAGLAYYIALKKPAAQGRVPFLKGLYDECMNEAMAEDRDRSPVRLAPRIR